MSRVGERRGGRAERHGEGRGGMRGERPREGRAERSGDGRGEGRRGRGADVGGARGAGGRSGARGTGDEAVSSVVAAVLVFALVTSAFVFWTATTLPDWVAQREAERQDVVLDRFGQLQTALARPEDAPALDVSIPLRARAVPVLQSTPATGEVGVEDAFRWQVQFTNGRTHLVDGLPYGAVDAPAAPAAATDVAAFTALQLRLQTSTVTNAREAWVEAVADDGTTSVTIRLVHAGRNLAVGCTEAELRLETVTAAGLQQETLLCGVEAALDRTQDALATRFGSALGGLQPGYGLSVTAGGSAGVALTGTYAAAWTDPEGRVHVRGAGAAATDADVEGKVLRFRPETHELDRQDLVWDGGAVAGIQDAGEALLLEPSFRLSVSGTEGHVDWTVVRLQGSGAALGAAPAQVGLRHLRTTESVHTADAADLTVTSTAAAAWRAYLSDRVTLAGATDATVDGTGDQAVLHLGQGTVTSWTLRVRVVDADVRVR